MSNIESLTLAELMAVTPGEGPDRFVGLSDAYGAMGVYGGHLIGQALGAVFQTVDEPKRAQSFHAYFINPGDAVVPIEYHVSRLREGRNSDLRQIQAWQNGKLVFQMTAAFKLSEAADEHQTMMPWVEAPETLKENAIAAGTQFAPPPTKSGRSEMVLASDHFMREDSVAGREAMLRLWMGCSGSGWDAWDRKH